MLDLKLRQEFAGKRLKGTAIELSNREGNGAIQVAASDFLSITYPTHDVLKGIEAIGSGQGRPIVVIGERGSGKSHLMAALHHSIQSPEATQQWLESWSRRLNEPTISNMQLRTGMKVIGANMHQQEYKFLWDLLFDNHPQGERIRGKWEGMGERRTEVPPLSLLEELLTAQPVMLLIDEFQTWYDGLTSTKQFPWRQWAFNFIQLLSELSATRPDLLVLVVSVRNGASDAYQQIHRNNPVLIDFKAGGSAERIQQDRRRMLLHRLFENRAQVPEEQIEQAIKTHVQEYIRLKDVASSEHERTRKQFLEAWPFAPHLLQLLEDQVLVATDAQETRDLIRILANLYKNRGESVPLLTAADFQIEDDASGIGALLDSVSNQHHRDLRERAQRNILSVKDAVPGYKIETPHLEDIMSSLWLRSIAVGNLAGAERTVLQIDATRTQRIDDNTFQAELATIIENSFNIHEDASRLVFKVEENPQAKLMSISRNDKQFLDGSDLRQLAKETRYVLTGSGDISQWFRVIVLPKDWISNPWQDLADDDKPQNWDDRLPILVLPEDPDRIHERLGRFLKDQLNNHRNAVRFLIPNSSQNMFTDRELVILARAVFKSDEFARQDPEYRKLHNKYQTTLRDNLKGRFTKVAILDKWNFVDPSQCIFHIEQLSKTGSEIPDNIRNICSTDLWVQEDFSDLIIAAAGNNDSMGKLLKELQEPRAGGNCCIPWLGETEMKERIIKLCSKGKIALNVRGSSMLQSAAGEPEEAAFKRMRAQVPYTGRQLDEVFIMTPSAGPSTGGATIADQTQSNSIETGPHANQSGVSTDNPDVVGSLWGKSEGSPFSNNGSIEAPKEPKVHINRTKERTSALNHIGQLELWAIGPATPLQNVNLRITSSNGAQLKDLLKKLPDGLTFDLSLEVEEQ